MKFPTDRIERLLAALLATTALSLGACAASGVDDGTDDTQPTCEGDSCDDPGASADRECRTMCKGDASCVKTCRDGKAMEHCTARESDALKSAQRAFVPNALRWACADVEGVNTNGGDDRGQEYCEYFAVVQAPPAKAGDPLPPAVTIGRAGSSDPLSVNLNADQLNALEDASDAVVGQCVFTSWHQDIAAPLPVCGAGQNGCPPLTLADTAKLPSWSTQRSLGIPLSPEFMRMRISINSNNAAADLFEKCLSNPLQGDRNNPQDPLHRPYMRGCLKTYGLFKTEWRRSDPTVCTAATRLAECGCGVDTNADGKADVIDIVEISRALVPFQPEKDGTLRLRGFHLGTWSDMNGLPPGCRYIETGDKDSTKTLVSCDLTASDLLAAAKDPKAKCREKYGDNVVVHVPVPASAVVCTPPAGGQYSATCGQQPWVLGAPTGN